MYAKVVKESQTNFVNMCRDVGALAEYPVHYRKYSGVVGVTLMISHTPLCCRYGAVATQNSFNNTEFFPS